MVLKTFQRNIFSILLALLIAIFFYKMIEIDTLARVVKVELQAEAKNKVQAYFKMSSDKKAPAFSAWNQSNKQTIGAGKEMRQFNLYNHRVYHLALQIDDQADINISKITFKGYFSKDLVLRGAQIKPYISQTSKDAKITFSQNGMRIIAHEKPSNIFFKKPIRLENQLLNVGLPLLIFLLVLAAIKLIDFSKIGALEDLKTRKNANSTYRSELDGLRGVAALMVLTEHTLDNEFLGFGRTGVWIFFILSGYLLANSFLQSKKKAYDLAFLGNYMLRRINRIVPMYYVTVIILFWFPGKTEKLFNHFTFIQAESHLWTIPQEMFFYLLLPFLMFIFYGLFIINKSLPILFLSILAILLVFQPSIMPFSLYALGTMSPPFVGWFLLGILVAYVDPEKGKWRQLFSEKFINFISQFSLLIFLGLILFSTSFFNESVFDVAQKTKLPITYGSIYGLVAALLLFLILVNPKGWLNNLLSLQIIRLVGIVGYSFYLLHPIIGKLFLPVITLYTSVQISGLMALIITFSTTLAASIATYSLIERPFLDRQIYKLQKSH